MKISRIVSILIVLSLCVPAASAQSKKQKPITPKKAAKSKQSAKKPPLATIMDTEAIEVEVVEVLQAKAYTYVKVKTIKGYEYWAAIPKDDLAVGSKFKFADAAKMSNFTSKDLKRTFDEVYFIGGILKEGAEPPQDVVEPAIDPMPDNEIHDVEAVTVEQANAYTYLKVKEGESVYWIAIAKIEIAAGTKFSFKGGLRMGSFKSKDLGKTFEDIYFVGSTSLDEDRPAPSTAIAGHENIDLDNISVERAAGGVTVGEVFANKNDHADKTIRVRGRVVKFSKNIMGMNWVHLQDGTGGEGTNDLTITTSETAAFGEIVTFEGVIILDKDFGAGYAYDVIMQQGKRIND